jgi:Pentapeptide repeats (9 copies)/Pentapeptide repeats (8 copies)
MLGRSGGLPRDLTGQTFVDCDFSGLDLTGVLGARVSSFIRCDFSGADLFGVPFQDSVLDGCNFSGAQLGKCEFWGTRISDCTFEGALLIRAEFSRAVIMDSSFRQANLLAASLSDSVLRRCVFDGADLSGALLSGNQEDGVNWSRVTGLIRTVAVASALAAPGAVAAAPTETRFLSVVEQLLGYSLADPDAPGLRLGLRLAPDGGNEFFQFFRAEQASAPLFTAAELRQDRRNRARAILIVTVSNSVCVTRATVLRRFGQPTLTPPSPHSSASEEYVSFKVNGAKLSFGFTQQRPECVASVVVNRLE